MQKTALIVASAAGPSDGAAAVLQRFGYGTIDSCATIEDALPRIHSSHLELVILPVQDLGPIELATLEREIRRSAAFFIGTAPKPDSEVILRAMRAGVHEFLVSPPDPNELAAAVDRFTRRQQSSGSRGQVFAIYSAKGGIGSTTLAVNLSHALGRNHPDGRVAVMDLVVGGGDVRILLNLKTTYDMASLVEKLDRVDAELMFSLLTPYSEGLWALPGPESPEFEEVLESSTVNTIIQHMRTHFAFTIIDCEHNLSDRTLAALDVADRILLNTELSVPALRATQRTLTLCRRLGYPEDKLCVVVSRYQSGEVLSISDATEVLKREPFWKIPNDYRSSSDALSKGKPVTETNPDSKLAWSYTQLAARLGGGISTHRNGATPAHAAGGLRRLFGFSKRSQ